MLESQKVKKKNLSKYVISGIMHRLGIYVELLAFAHITVVFSSTAKVQKITL